VNFTLDLSYYLEEFYAPLEAKKSIQP